MRSTGPARPSAKRLGVGEGEGLGNELAEHDREQREQDGDDEQRDDRRGVARHARATTSEVRRAPRPG